MTAHVEIYRERDIKVVGHPDGISDVVAVPGTLPRQQPWVVTDPRFAGGATGDGVTDDTAAIQAAAGGYIVYFPPGTYKITTPMSLPPAKWRWRFVKNDRVMADSGQGYSRRIDCLNGCATVLGGSLGVGGISRIESGRGRTTIPVRDLTRQP